MNKHRIAIATLVAASGTVVSTGLQGPVTAPAALAPATSPGPGIGTSGAVLPAPTGPVTAAPGTTASTIAAPRVSVPVVPGPGQSRWRVASGESVYSIARKFAMTPAELASANGWAEGIDRLLFVGDVILVDTPPTTTSPPTTSPSTTQPSPPPVQPPVTVPTTAPSAPVAPNGCAAARYALAVTGASRWEINFGVRIAKRESRCTLNVHRFTPNTRDDSWGPWQINYYGPMRSGMTKLVGTPESNTASWNSAAKNFLRLLRSVGACAWTPPRYCSGK